VQPALTCERVLLHGALAPSIPQHDASENKTAGRLPAAPPVLRRLESAPFSFSRLSSHSAAASPPESRCHSQSVQRARFANTTFENPRQPFGVCRFYMRSPDSHLAAAAPMLLLLLPMAPQLVARK